MFIPLAPHWLAQANTPQAHYRHWLGTQRLSDSLQQHGTITLQLRSMSWQTPQPHEQWHYPNAKHVFIRSIALVHQHTILSTGRVCFSPENWQLWGHKVASLGTQPIGETWLHHSPSIQRSQFGYRALSLQQQQQMGYPTDTLAWARYSYFGFDDGSSMLLTETLSPQLNQWPLAMAPSE